MLLYTPSFYPIGAPVPRRKTRAFFCAIVTATSTEPSVVRYPMHRCLPFAVRWVNLSEHRRANAGERLASRIRWVNLSEQIWVNFAERLRPTHVG